VAVHLWKSDLEVVFAVAAAAVVVVFDYFWIIEYA
jgi:hypothetical protein